MKRTRGHARAVTQARVVSAIAAAMLLSACAPDVSGVAGSYAESVSGANAAMEDIVGVNTRARKRLDYRSIAMERSILRIAGACNEIFQMAAWTGGALVSTEGAPNEEERVAALAERHKRLTALAKDCAVEVGSADASGRAAEGDSDIVIPARLRDPIYLCGIDPSRLSVAQAGVTEPAGSGGSRLRIPPLPLDVAAQTRIAEALAAYAAALKEAAEARDLAALQSAAESLVASLTKLAALAGPFGVVAAPAVEAVGGAATALTGSLLRESRFRFIKKTVAAADGAVRDSAAIVCHGALLLSYEVVRAENFLLNDLVDEYNIARRRVATDFAGDREIVAMLEASDRALAALRGVGTHDVVTPFLGVAEAHGELRAALEDPKRDFKAAIKLMKSLVGQFQEIRKTTAALVQS